MYRLTDVNVLYHMLARFLSAVRHAVDGFIVLFHYTRLITIMYQKLSFTLRRVSGNQINRKKVLWMLLKKAMIFRAHKQL